MPDTGIRRCDQLSPRADRHQMSRRYLRTQQHQQVASPCRPPRTQSLASPTNSVNVIFVVERLRSLRTRSLTPMYVSCLRRADAWPGVRCRGDVRRRAGGVGDRGGPCVRRPLRARCGRGRVARGGGSGAVVRAARAGDRRPPRTRRRVALSPSRAPWRWPRRSRSGPRRCPRSRRSTVAADRGWPRGGRAPRVPAEVLPGPRAVPS